MVGRRATTPTEEQGVRTRAPLVTMHRRGSIARGSARRANHDHSLTHWYLTGVLAALVLSAACPGQHLAYSTFDWNKPATNNWNEGWADVKTPGDGRTYAVGTTQLDYNDPAHQQFSNAVCSDPVGVAHIGSPTVAILQVSDATGIVWQRFFHGDGGTLQANPVTTHARAVSVFPADWPGATFADWRVAICGQTTDRRLPESPSGQLAPWVAQGFGGFIAVYDGLGSLKWSYNFYGEDPGAGTVITDISIHIDSRTLPRREVVTYCGMSSNGMFASGLVGATSTIAPVRPFLAPPASAFCTTAYPGGAVHHAASTSISTNQYYDGIVGRLSAPHGAGPTAVVQEFHSIVGGSGTEGLLGIAEQDWDRFAVVGTTEGPSTSTSVFPLTNPVAGGAVVCLDAATYRHGVVATFDASQTTTPGGVLILQASTLIGATGASTAARDVLAHGGLLYVVGSTDDPNISVGGNPIGLPTSGASGYLAVTADPALKWDYVSYAPQGLDSVDTGLVGVAAWNEYPDHVALFGWSRKSVTAVPCPREWIVASVFRDTVASPWHMDLIRSHEIKAPDGDEEPAASEAFTGIFSLAAAPYNFTHLGAAHSGGISVDPRGLITVVGSTRSSSQQPTSDYPFDLPPAGRPPQGGTSGVDIDAIRSVVEMLPDGVCRSDGTGRCPPSGSWAPVGDGGTTPVCARALFGEILGTTPGLKRMFVDFEGVPGSGNIASIIVDRPPASSSVVGSFLQLGFASNTPSADPLWMSAQLEIWANSSTVLLNAYLPLGGSVREPLSGASGLPPGSFDYYVQFVSLLAQPLGAPCTAGLTLAASPAVVFGY